MTITFFYTYKLDGKEFKTKLSAEVPENPKGPVILDRKVALNLLWTKLPEILRDSDLSTDAELPTPLTIEITNIV